MANQPTNPNNRPNDRDNQAGKGGVNRPGATKDTQNRPQGGQGTHGSEWSKK